MDSTVLACSSVYLHPGIASTFSVRATSHIWKSRDSIVPRKRAFLEILWAWRVPRLRQVNWYPDYCDQAKRCNFRRDQHCIINAISSEAISAAVTVAVVGASAIAVIQLNKDKISSAILEKPKCEACNGTGVCSTCNGEGFLLKSLSAEAAAKARANAKDAASRYTAGLAKKWSYCMNCSGSRGCPACKGRGWVEKLDDT